MRFTNKSILFFLLAGLAFVGCSGGLETTSVDEGIVTLRLLNAINGTSTSEVSAASPGTLQATVTDVNGNPLMGLVVTFITNERGVPYPGTALTNSSGVATVGLFAGSIPGADTATAYITTSSGTFSDSVGFYTKGDQPKQSLIVLELESTEILVGETATMTATVTDEEGEPKVNTSVAFSTTLGSVSPATAATASDGLAISILSAGSEPGTGLATASVSGASASVNFTVVAEEVEEELDIVISLALESTVLEQDTDTLMTATVTYEDGTPVANRTVIFSTTLGSVSPASAATADDGIATSTLSAGSTAGDGTATAKISEASDSIDFTVE